MIHNDISILPTKIVYEGKYNPGNMFAWNRMVYSEGLLDHLKELCLNIFKSVTGMYIKFSDHVEWIVQIETDDTSSKEKLEVLKTKTTLSRKHFNFDIELR